VRRSAIVPEPKDVKRVMIYAHDRGALLFLYDSIEDRSCVADEWYESLAAAESAAREQYGITVWTEIPDPTPGCFDDRIAAVRRA
jgi:hypothetical protein